MIFSPWFRWLKSLRRHGRHKSYQKQAPPFTRLALEALEDRTLLSTLPAAVVTNPTSMGGGISPQVAYDPINPLKLVEVNSTGAAISGRYSINQGVTWSNFALPGNLFDPNTGVAYVQATNPSVTI